jgi:hypothetical protein
MEAHELEVLWHYTDNGKPQIAVIPQYAVPPLEQWSIDFLGIDLRSRSLLFIEVTAAQTPSRRFVDKLRRRHEWIPIVRKQLIEETTVIDKNWRHTTVAFVIDSRVEWLRRRLENPTDVIVEPLSNCYPYWLTGKEPLRGQPRLDLEGGITNHSS